MLEIFAAQLVNKATTSDLRATQLLLTLMRFFPEPVEPKPKYKDLTMAELDALIMGELEKVKWPRRIK